MSGIITNDGVGALFIVIGRLNVNNFRCQPHFIILLYTAHFSQTWRAFHLLCGSVCKWTWLSSRWEQNRMRVGVYFSAIMMYLEQVKCREQNLLATFHSLKIRYHLVILRISLSETHKTRLKYIFIVHDNYASVLKDLIRRKYQGHAFHKMQNSNELAQICIL